MFESRNRKAELHNLLTSGEFGIYPNAPIVSAFSKLLLWIYFFLCFFPYKNLIKMQSQF